MHPEHREVFNQGCSFDSPFYRNTLDQTDSQTKRQTCIQKKIKVKKASALKRQLCSLLFFPLLSIHMYGHPLHPVKLKLVEMPSISEPQCIEPEVH